MNKNLTIELTRLSEGRMRTTVRELKVIIEDYFLKEMLMECVHITEDAGDK